MPNIIPHLWYDNEAKQAAELYTSVFGNSRIKSTATLHDTPSGTVELIAIEIAGQEFRLLKAGPFVKFTPAVSFLVACSSKDEVDAIWSALSEGGMALMELGNYPFSERYGWTQDRFGLSWQVMFMGGREIKQKIIPTLMFVDNQCGKAEEAITFYASVFPNASVDHIMRYGANEPPDADGTIRHAAFTLNGQQFAAMDSARAHNFGFNEAISFIVRCDTQQELDSFSAKLSSRPRSGAVRMDQGQVQAFLADRPRSDGRDDGRRRSGKAGPGDSGLSQNEEVRHKETRRGICESKPGRNPFTKIDTTFSTACSQKTHPEHFSVFYLNQPTRTFSVRTRWEDRPGSGLAALPVRSPPYPMRPADKRSKLFIWTRRPVPLAARHPEQNLYMRPTDTSNPDYFHKVVDCQWACPAHTNVPEYIRLIAQGRYTDAYMLNRESNIFPGILGARATGPVSPPAAADACPARTANPLPSAV